VPVNHRPKLSRHEVLTCAAKLSELAEWMAGRGMPLAYHDQMGAITEDEDDVNWLM
jgi:inosose dehydratase